MKIKLICLFLSLITVQTTGCIPLIYAQSSTASGQVKTATSSSFMQEKLNALKLEIASKAAAIKQQVSTKLENKAFAGVLSSKSDTQLLIVSKNGERKININEYTEYVNKTKAKISNFDLTDIKENNYIVALGDVDDNKILTAKKVVLIDTPKENNTTLVWGQIKKSSGGVITLKNRDGDDITISPINAAKYFLGGEESSILDAKVDKFLISRGTLNDKKLTASYIFFVPQVGFITPQKSNALGLVATASASPSAKPKK